MAAGEFAKRSVYVLTVCFRLLVQTKKQTVKTYTDRQTPDHTILTAAVKPALQESLWLQFSTTNIHILLMGNMKSVNI